MKRLAAITATVLLCTFAWAQKSLDDVIALLQSGDVVSCSYSYTLKGNVPIKGSGTAVICGTSYHISENGLDTWCDGNTVWTVDSESKEVVVSEGGNSILANPGAYRSIVQNLRYDGRSLSCTIESQSSEMDFKASGITVTPSSEESFAFDTAGLPKSWIITDLR